MLLLTVEWLLLQVIAAVGAGYVPYFIAAIFFCSFYLLNLVLAVVALSYEQEIKSVVNEVSINSNDDDDDDRHDHDGNADDVVSGGYSDDDENDEIK